MKLSHTLAIAACAASIGIAAPAAAETPQRPVLELATGLCQNTADFVLDWARHHKTIGSYAVPTSRQRQTDCAPLADAKATFTYEYSNQAESDAKALALCNEVNAGKAHLGRCVIVGRLRPGPV